MKIIIPSRKRPEMAQRLQTILPESIVCIAESEYGSYRDLCNNIEAHPDNISGIAPLRQWILNHWEGPLVMIDDDVMRLYCLTDQYARVIKFDNWPAVIENAAIMAEDLGANVFGFNQAWDVRKYRPMDPFRLTGWVGGVIGIIGREIEYKKQLLLRADIDFCLENLLKFRIIWVDSRYSFMQDRSSMPGGNSINRSSSREADEIAWLDATWGKHLTVKEIKTTKKLTVNVKRKFSTVI